MEINKSKNINTGKIDTNGGHIDFGDSSQNKMNKNDISEGSKARNSNTGRITTHGGSVYFGDNIYYKLDHKALQEKIEELEILFSHSKNQEKKDKYGKELIETQKTLIDFKQEVIELAKSFFSSTQETDRIKEAKKNLILGDIKKARAVFDTKIMANELNCLLSEKEGNQEQLSKKADEFLFLARLTIKDLKLPNRLELAKSHFEWALKAYQSKTALKEFIQFLDDNKIESEAITLHESRKELLHKKDSNNTLKLAEILKTCGNLQLENEDFEAAEKSYQDALAKFRTLSKENSGAYLHEETEILKSLWKLYDEINDTKNSENNYIETISLQRKLATEDPLTFFPLLADSLNNLGILQWGQKKYNVARKNYKEAKEIRKKLKEMENEEDSS